MSIRSKLATLGLKLRALPYREYSCREAFIKEDFTLLFIFDSHRFRVLKPESEKWLKDNDIPYIVTGTDGTLRVFGKSNSEIVNRDLVEPLSLSIVVMRWRLKEFLDWCEENSIISISSTHPKANPQVGDATYHLIGAENVLMLKMRFTSTSKFKWLYVIE